VSGVAIAAASVLAVPALASAAPAVSAPKISTSTDASSITVSVQNTNADAGTTCGAWVIPASKVSELQKDPTKLLEPGFAVWKVKNADRVGASSTKEFTTPSLHDGMYAVIGECTSASGVPAATQPQVVSLPENALFGSLGNGALQNLLEFLSNGNIDGLIQAISAGSSQPA